MLRCLILLSVMAAVQGQAEVLDRIAIAVGNRAVKERQIESELRVTEFLNGSAVDLGERAKRSAADRLIDQTLIRAEMAKATYPAASEDDVKRVLAGIKQTRFPKSQDYQRALEQYGITEQELKTHLAWQIEVLRFIDLRFEPAVRAQPVRNANQRPLGDRVNDAFFAWLEEARKHARIQFHEEVFR
jgi:hypothetical protein